VIKLLLASLLVAALCAGYAGATRSGGQPVALVTAEQQNQLLAVTLPEGKVIRRVRLPADPENVIAGPGLATIVVSAKAGAVTLLDTRSLRIIKIFRGLRSPHLAAFSPSGAYAYVTDDGSGALVVIQLARPKIVARLFVGTGAHHLAFDPNGRRLWIALGERARTIAIVNTTKHEHPRLLGRFDPGYTVHDLAFSPNGKQIWLTSDDQTNVHVINARTHQLLFRVPAGAPPQHVAFNNQVQGLANRAWLTSGYDSRIELVDTHNGRILGANKTPYGSFNIATNGSLIVTASLLNGTVSEFNETLHHLSTVRVANSTRDVALAVW
jgi:hypothetical protein